MEMKDREVNAEKCLVLMFPQKYIFLCFLKNYKNQIRYENVKQNVQSGTISKATEKYQYATYLHCH